MLDFQKSGWWVKSFLSHRKSSSLDESSNNVRDPDPDSPDMALSTGTSARLSWLSQNHSIEILPPLSKTTHSSASSLCSCDCDANLVQNLSPLSKIDSSPSPSRILYLPSLSTATALEDGKTGRQIISAHLPRSHTPKTLRPDLVEPAPSTATAELTFDLLEALEMDLQGDDKILNERGPFREDSDMEDVSGNVEQLRRETDEVFQAVATALADVKADTQRWNATAGSISIRSTLTVPYETSRKPKSHVTPTNSSLSRTTSISKAKKKKTRFLGKTLCRGYSSPANTPSTWTLTDVTMNMAGMFTGRKFRTEVDEMLTPDRIKQLKSGFGAHGEQRECTESRSVKADDAIPKDIFDLEDGSPRIKTSQRNSSPSPRPVLPHPSIPRLKRRPPSKHSNFHRRKVQFADPVTTEDNQQMTVHDLAFPSPPCIPRCASVSKGVPLPPANPEIPFLAFSPNLSNTLSLSSAPSQSPQTQRQRQPRPRLQPLQSASHTILPSTSFTFTSPLFLHGPISIERPSRELRHKDLLSPVEEQLDWVAFQIAISGTEKEDFEYEQLDEDEAEIDDIVAWWEGFRFPGYGMMVQDVPEIGNDKGELREESLKNTGFELRTSGNMGIGNKEAATKSRRLEEKWNGGIDTEKIVVQNQVGASKGGFLRTQSMANCLSPSSTLVPSLSSSNDEDVIPMGHNLGHDLEHFLQWEMRHVQARHIDD